LTRRAAYHSLTVVTLILLAGLFFVVTTRAHGVGTPRVLNAPSGPYLLSAWTDPDPLRADETHVVVAVLKPDTQEPIVTGVTVTVRFTSLEDPTAAVAEVASTDDTNQLLYAAEFNDELTPGRWEVGVTPDGERGGGSEVTFEVTVEAARGFNWLWAGAGGLVVVLAAWLVVSMRASETRRGRPAR